MSDTMNYQCPACGGPLRYDGTTGKMVCDYCESTYSVEEIEALYKEKDDASETAAAKKRENASEEEFDYNMFNCPSCGAEIICDANTNTTSCPYCGNPTVIPGRFSGNFHPDYIIPFKISKKQAVAALSQHMNGKRLMPRAFRDQQILEEIKGVYVPFWMFDVDSRANMVFHGENTKIWRDSRYEYKRTDHYNVERGGDVSFEKIPVQSSSKVSHAMMESLEPFDSKAAEEFKKSYMAGYFADNYDISKEDSFERAKPRFENSVRQALQNVEPHYGMLIKEGEDIRLKGKQGYYALLPVWMLNVTWNNNKYPFAVNGQTGKIVGDLPMDRAAYWRYRLLMCIPCTAISLAAILYFLAR